MNIPNNISELKKGLLGKQFTASELLDSYLEKIHAENKKYNDFILVLDDFAKKQAQAIDEKIKNNEELGKLAGLVLAIKDNILIKEIITTAGSNILSNYKASYNATIIEKLLAEDVIFVGKTNMDEFACGSTNTTSAYGNVLNPLNIDYVPGGSSGGSAAAVAAKHCLAALGTDTGGSVRQPASFCGLVGLKPTYGAVSRYGLVAMASSFDQAGVLASNVDDTFKIFEIMQGKDKHDLTTIDYNFEFLENTEKDLSGLKIGIIPEYFQQTTNPEAYSKIVEDLKSLGAEIEEVELKWTDLGLAVYYILQPAELSTNLSRFDGIRYGKQIEKDDLNDLYKATRGAGFGAEIKRRLILGSFVLSASYYDAYYKKAQKVRALIRNEYEELFKKVDLLFLPTSPSVALKLEADYDPLKLYLEDIFTVGANVAGIPALTMPIANDEKLNLPYGGQFMAAWKEEDLLYRVAKNLETKIHNI